MRVAVLLSYVAFSASSCDGAGPGGKVPGDQQALYQLINREWKTFARLRTGSDGTVSLRGFRGTYRIGVRQGDEQIESKARLLADGTTVELRMK